MNKKLICIITTLKNALWANHVTPNPSLNTSPYFLVYGKEAILPPNIYLPALHLSQESQGKPCQLVQCRIDALHKIQEERMKEKEKFTLHQNRIKRWFDNKSTGKANFDVGDLVLKWDKPHEDKGKRTKFQSMWIGSYIVHEKLGPHTYCLQSLDGRIDNFLFKNRDLKHYFQ